MKLDLRNKSDRVPRRRGFRGTLLAKITATFVVLLLVLGAVQFFLVIRTTFNLTHAADQMSQWSTARDAAAALKPELASVADEQSFRAAVTKTGIARPDLLVLLLESDGRIRFADADLPPGPRVAIPLSALQLFLSPSGQASAPIVTLDPEGKSDACLFSVHPIEFEGRTHYLFLKLFRQRSLGSVLLLRERIVKQSLTLLLLTILPAGLVGLLLFYYLTRRLRTMTSVLAHYEQGNFTERIAVDSGDEIAEHAAAINRMADAIEAQVEALQRKDELRRELIANIAHDLRRPVSLIRSHSEVGLGVDLSAEKRREYYSVIVSSSDSLSKMLNELVDLAKFEAQETSLVKEPVRLSDLADDLVLAFSRHAAAQNVKLVARLDPEIPVVLADISLIGRVLANLVENAIRCTPEGGRVTVAVERHREGVTVAVEDTGVGISPADLPYVFERSFQGANEAHPAQGMSGLGLTIAKNIVEAHGSSLHVRSSEEHGTVFSFTISNTALNGTALS